MIKIIILFIMFIFSLAFSEEIPNELQNIASSLRIENSTPVQREPLLAFILNEFEKLYKDGSNTWIENWKKYCNHINKRIVLNNNKEVVKGLFLDINEDGNAILDIESEQVVIYSGVLEIL